MLTHTSPGGEREPRGNQAHLGSLHSLSQVYKWGSHGSEDTVKLCQFCSEPVFRLDSRRPA